MFELEGIQYSVEDLQAAAKKYEMEYDAYLEVMMGKGLKETKPVKTEAVATETAPVTAVNEAVDTDLASENGSSESQESSEGLTFGEPIDYDFDNPEEAENSGRRFVQLKKGGRIYEDDYLLDVENNPRDKYNRLKPDTFEKYVLANKWKTGSIGTEGIKEPKKKTSSYDVAKKVLDDVKTNFSNTEAENQ